MLLSQLNSPKLGRLGGDAGGLELGPHPYQLPVEHFQQQIGGGEAEQIRHVSLEALHDTEQEPRVRHCKVLQPCALVTDLEPMAERHTSLASQRTIKVYAAGRSRTLRVPLLAAETQAASVGLETFSWHCSLWPQPAGYTLLSALARACTW